MRSVLPDPAARNPEEAIHYAQIARRLSDNKNWSILNTLAAALADAGRWDEANSLQEKVVAAIGDTSDEFQEHLDLIRNRKPIRKEYSNL